MRPVWWTCGCGKRQITRQRGDAPAAGLRVSVACGKPAGFTIDPPKGQGGLEFGSGDAERDGG